MVRGVYAGRYFAISLGEDPIQKYWLLRQKAAIFDVPEKPLIYLDLMQLYEKSIKQLEKFQQ